MEGRTHQFSVKCHHQLVCGGLAEELHVPGLRVQQQRGAHQEAKCQVLQVHTGVAKFGVHGQQAIRPSRQLHTQRQPHTDRPTQTSIQAHSQIKIMESGGQSQTAPGGQAAASDVTQANSRDLTIVFTGCVMLSPSLEGLRMLLERRFSVLLYTCRDSASSSIMLPTNSACRKKSSMKRRGP